MNQAMFISFLLGLFRSKNALVLILSVVVFALGYFLLKKIDYSNKLYSTYNELRLQLGENIDAKKVQNEVFIKVLKNKKESRDEKEESRDENKDRQEIIDQLKINYDY